MDAKRLVPVLHVQAGRIVDPGDGGDLGPPATWARRLEMEGADELLLVELDRGGPPRRAWLHVDLYAWNGRERPGRPAGAEAQTVRALYSLIVSRYGLG